MMDLIRSELRRIWSRRMVRVLAVLSLVGSAVGVTIGAVNSHAGSGIQLSGLPDILRGTSFIVFVMGLMIGGSSVGADWQQGTMATLLTWEPRRVRVFLTRAGVVTLFVFALAVFLLVAFSLMFAAGAALRGGTDTGSAWLRDVAGTTLRIGVASAAGAALALAIGMIGRNTAAALGVVFGYLAIAASLLRGLIPKISNELFSSNVVVFIDGRAGTSETGSIITVGRASITMALYAGVLLLIALVLFRTRDVT
jgi:ABC-2 type transport system permease protein